MAFSGLNSACGPCHLEWGSGVGLTRLQGPRPPTHKVISTLHLGQGSEIEAECGFFGCLLGAGALQADIKNITLTLQFEGSETGNTFLTRG